MTKEEIKATVPDGMLMAQITDHSFLVYCKEGKMIGIQCKIDGELYKMPLAGTVELDQLPEEFDYKGQYHYGMTFVLNNDNVKEHIKNILFKTDNE